MINVQIAENLRLDEESAKTISALLEQAAAQTLLQVGSPSQVDLTLVLSDDEHLQALNQQFLETQAPTDVLAFPDGEIDPDSQIPYLGDVILSYPRALAQAEAGGHPATSELQLLTVHGVLHLLGYDHLEASEKARMWAKQAEILRALGCEVNPP